VIHDDLLAKLKILDEDVKMPIADVSDRIPFTGRAFMLKFGMALI